MSSKKVLSLGLACSVCSTKRMYSAGSGTLQAGGRQSKWGSKHQLQEPRCQVAPHSRLAHLVCGGNCRVPHSQHRAQLSSPVRPQPSG